MINGNGSEEFGFFSQGRGGEFSNKVLQGAGFRTKLIFPALFNSFISNLEERINYTFRKITGDTKLGGVVKHQ